MDAAELARAFALGEDARLSDGPVARGKQGVVWKLETNEGRWAVKMPLVPILEADVRVSTAFQETMYAAGVRTPQVRRTRQGTVFATIGDHRVRAYEWVDLLPPDPSVDPGLVGELVAAIHRVVIPADGPPSGWDTQPVGPAAWDALVHDLRAAGAPFAEQLADLRHELVALEAWIEPPTSLQLCHCDLWADNVLGTVDGELCAIDWDNAGAADPSQELGCVLFEFARGDPTRARRLMDAYRGSGGPARVDRRGHFSMLIAQLGHITETASHDWLTPNARSPRRADSEAWVGEVFDEPHTRAALDNLLRAANQPEPA